MIENQLTTFRENFPMVRVMVYETYIVYKVGKGLAIKAAEDAQNIIDKLGLALSACPTKFSSNDSFFVQSSEVEL